MSEIRNLRTAFKTIQIIYGALMVGVVVLSFVIYGVILKNPVYEVDTSDIFLIIVPIVAVIGVFASEKIFRTIINSIHAKDNLPAKLSKYQTATIVKGALLEGLALLAAVAAMQTNNLFYFTLVAIMVVVMYLKFPSIDKFKNEVALSLEEKSQIN